MAGGRDTWPGCRSLALPRPAVSPWTATYEPLWASVYLSIKKEVCTPGPLTVLMCFNLASVTFGKRQDNDPQRCPRPDPRICEYVTLHGKRALQI